MTVIFYYIIMFEISLICSAVYFWKWHRHFEIYYSLCYALMPIVMAGYLLLALSEDLGGALVANKIVYLGGCYLQLIITLSIFSLCRIKMPRAFTFILICLSTAVYFGVMSIGYSGIFYRSAEITKKAGVTVLVKQYGPMHSMFHVLTFFYMALSIGAIIYAYRKKPDASIRTITMLLVTEIVAVCTFFLGRAVTDAIEWVPVSYIFAEIVYLVVADRICLYDIGDSLADQLSDQGEIGYIALDYKYHYLSSTGSAKRFLPFLVKARVDRMIGDPEFKHLLEDRIWEFRKDDVPKDHFYKRDGKLYRVQIDYLYDGKRRRGYQCMIVDETKHLQYLREKEPDNPAFQAE